MSSHSARTIERQCDVCVIGGSAAGLAAALQLGRQRRSVIVVDAGDPRNGPAAHMPGYLGGDGLPPSELIAAGREEVRSYGGEIIAGLASRVTRTDAGEFRVELAGGNSVIARRVLAAGGGSVAADAAPAGPRFRVPAEPFASLGLRPAVHPTGLGDFIETDATGETAVPGLYAAGNAADPGQQVPQAAADGSRVGAAISLSLAADDPRAAARPSANESDWDHRYAGDQMWSGNPNGTLVNEVSGLAPGRALDVGAGEGGDALWLAAHGWIVTASDISQRALDRVSAEAGRRGLRVECHRADANTAGAFKTAAFDLVSAQYASIPRTADDRGVRNILNAVAPGGTLLIVSHDLEPMRPVPAGKADGAQDHSRPFDPDAYVRVDDFAAALASSPAWDIELHDKRTRPAGAASDSHHSHDIVLRARRRPSDEAQ